MIFVGGIHGVGKSYFCDQVKSNLNIPHYSASELISTKKQKSFTVDKAVQKSDENTNYLIAALNELDEKNMFLLDGHFCLMNTRNEIERIPKSTFQYLKPSAVVMLINSLETIQQNLYKRDGKRYDKDFLYEFQKLEKEYSSEIARDLKIPFESINLEAPINSNISTIKSLFKFINFSMS
ncbi:ATP-binding protein [Sporosarcina globispora]|uniref:ATP-binding protein n=1 Tax=Sporosarcina globispora TaxID=1459 RepID=UPI0006A96563|nr:ATP-binding protein [Sporosarcina globispora]